MPQCITPSQMIRFLDITGLEYTWGDFFLVHHALTGDVYWKISDNALCFAPGILT